MSDYGNEAMFSAPKDVLQMIFNYVFDDYLKHYDVAGRNEMLAQIKNVCESWCRATVKDPIFMISFLNKKCKKRHNSIDQGITEHFGIDPWDDAYDLDDNFPIPNGLDDDG